jgi:hypothetical protein
MTATTDKTLTVEIWREGNGWWNCELFIDGVRDSGFGRDFPNDEEEFVALLADLVSDEMAITLGGWPTCPDHQTHPLDAVLDEASIAVWKCPRGRTIARIGDLRPIP